ncbi:quinohemoprotein amine dehydrogenase subunit alpha [Neptunomonas sp.]|uniref:quinohemoprotein amine dehydrogenase subunit alpha n=1 Tax=Neptunomonas sp. TaxID=1971898 RepID=UPI003565F5E5
MKKTPPIVCLMSGLLTAASLSFTPSANAAGAADAESIVQQKCVACHEVEGKTSWSRISHQRKTPEGWLMSIARMQIMHGLKISDDERHTLVKYLADRQGLAPSETEGARYALERRLNTVESFESQAFTETCARCHSGARVMLQRRPDSEWEHLVHFHLGQWPTTEYQSLARDRDWLDLTLNEMVPELTAMLPLESKSWNDWQKSVKPGVAGSWTFAGKMPGKGEMNGVMQVVEGSKDQFSITLTGQYSDGTTFKGTGDAILYTGYEWRANLTVDGTPMRQVFSTAKTGEMQGRMYEREHDERGFDFAAVKQGNAEPSILAVQPEYIKAGDTVELSIVGTGLQGDVVLGKGLTLLKDVSSDQNKRVLQVKASSTVATGAQAIHIGKASSDIIVYDRVSSLKVIPAFQIARVGGNDSSTPKIEAAFEAEAWASGSDGVAGTADDVRIGFMPASWSVAPFDDASAADNDVHFSGRMNAASGVFTPALAGPNPERRMSTNNAGNLKVVAQVDDEGQSVTADGQLIVTVQRWNNPPIP